MSDQKNNFLSIKDISPSGWANLGQKKVYFGHQSVGGNIVNGIKDLVDQFPQIDLRIAETSNHADLKPGIFAHSKIGKNMDPRSKICSFENAMQNGLGSLVDMAFFKFCYIDINRNTDVAQLFIEYKKVMEQLKRNFPETLFIHITIPLKIVQTGLRVWIKKLIRRPIRGYDGNVKRNQFNDLLRKEYREREPLFDLASVESTRSDGSREKFYKNGHTYYALVPYYSHDGRHLNEAGRKKVAEQLLILLAKLSNS